jgi:hypothetical protein
MKPWRTAMSRAVSPDAVHTFESDTPGNVFRIGINVLPAKLPAPMKPTLAGEPLRRTPGVGITRGNGTASSAYCSTTPRNRSLTVPEMRS